MATVIRGDDNFDTSIGANVVQTHVTTISNQSLSNNTRVNITGLTATITPKSTASKIMVTVMWHGEGSLAGNQNTVFGIRRGGVDIGNSTAAGDRVVGIAIIQQGHYDANADSTPDSCNYSYLDSPSAATPLVYTATVIGEAQTLYNNSTVASTDAAGYERLTSSITLTEVQG